MLGKDEDDVQADYMDGINEESHGRKTEATKSTDHLDEHGKKNKYNTEQ